MGIHDRISQDFKEALKAKDKIRVAVLRMLKTSIKNKEVELRRELDEAEIMKAVTGQAKQRRDSIEQFTKGGREDLAKQEEAELAILESYLPKQLGQAELEAAAADVIAELEANSPKDMGKVMKNLMSRYAGQIDGKAAGETVKKILSAM